MFYGCSNLQSLDMTNCLFGVFYTGTTFDSMFEGLGSNLTGKAVISVTEVSVLGYSIKTYLENNKAAFKMNEAKAQISYQ